MKTQVLQVAIGLALLSCFACAETPERVPSAPTPQPQNLTLRGEIEVLGADQLASFVGCLDGRWIGSHSGFDHGNNGHGRVSLGLGTLAASNARLEPGRHELALIFVIPSARDAYSTEQPAFFFIVESETGRTVDSRSLVGRRATVEYLDAFGWAFTVDAFGRVTAFSETMLTREDVRQRQRGCVSALLP